MWMTLEKWVISKRQIVSSSIFENTGDIFFLLSQIKNGLIQNLELTQVFDVLVAGIASAPWFEEY